MKKEHLSGDASPTERTMAWLREQGYTVDKVEQKVRRNVTRDFCGFADIIAFSPGSRILAVQATTQQHLPERVAKIMEEPRALTWLRCQHRIWAVGWRLVGPEGKRKTYQARVVDMGIDGGGRVHATAGYNVTELPHE